MARMPRPWFRKGRGWYVTMNGQQESLGVLDQKDEAGAWAALRRLMADVGEMKAAVVRTTGKNGPVSQLVEEFIAEKRATIDASTLRKYRTELQWLVKTFPKAKVAALEVPAIVRAAAAVESWGDTHRANVLATIGSFLRWAGRNEKIPLPPKASRGAESVITEATYRKCLMESTGDFHQLLRFLWLTGCRPGEATGLTAEAVDWASGTVRLKQHKTRRKGKERILYLAAEAVEVLKEQSEKYRGSGLLFRGLRGRRLSLQSMTMRFQRLSEKVGVKVCSYGFRHSFCTRALSSGIPDAQVAAMMGHASTAMIFKHYSHVSHNARLLKELADKLAGKSDKPAA